MKHGRGTGVRVCGRGAAPQQQQLGGVGGAWMQVGAILMPATHANGRVWHCARHTGHTGAPRLHHHHTPAPPDVPRPL